MKICVEIALNLPYIVNIQLSDEILCLIAVDLLVTRRLHASFILSF